ACAGFGHHCSIAKSGRHGRRHAGPPPPTRCRSAAGDIEGAPQYTKLRAMASTTISSCAYQAVQGAHRLKICQFSHGIVGMDVNADGFIRSSTFRVGGFD
uniref:Uncharacterized protein n=1 Tax=Triticum urartu TaxID=4572 RepID=A0A8R7V891_TRIUA